MPAPFELRYTAAGGGHSPVDLEVSVTREGQARVYVGTSYSVPLQRVNKVGVFEGSAPTDALAALAEHVERIQPAPASGSSATDAGLPGSPGRSLRFSMGDVDAALDLTGVSADPEIDALERAVHRLALDMTEHASRALEATLHVSRVEAKVAAVVELRTIGVEPVKAMFLGDDRGDDPDVAASAQVRFEERMVLPSGAAMPLTLATAALSGREVGDLGLPVGAIDSAPGTTYRFPCGVVDLPRADNIVAVGQVDFWLDDGTYQRPVRVLTSDYPVG